MKEKVEYYIVNKEILPNSIQSVIKVNELIQKTNISKYEAIKKVGISRSTYYKYKDFIKPFFESENSKIYSIHITLLDRAGILSNVLDVIAKQKISVLTLVQNMPVDNIARTTIMIQTNSKMFTKIENVVDSIRKIDGIKDLRIIGSN